MKYRKPAFILAVMLGGFFPAVSSFAAEAVSAGGVVSSPVQQSPEEVEKYWTPERMRDAKPMPMPVPKNPGETVCTMDAKLCPDGSYVSRGGPNCEFAPCPESSPPGGAVDGPHADGPETEDREKTEP